MTISYNAHISSSRYFTFLFILLRWRGSIWKSVASEVLVWSLAYYVMFGILHCNLFRLENDTRRQLGAYAKYVDDRLKDKEIFPLSLMLGFFVKFVADRWRNIFSSMSFIEDPAYYIATIIRGSDSETRMLRRTIVRHLCLAQILALRDISVQVRKRFPTMDSVVESGFLLRHERVMLKSALKSGTKNYPIHWVPISWVFEYCYRAREQEKIASDNVLSGLLLEIREFRRKIHSLCTYDWVPVPLAYTQVVFLAVRIYFFLAVFCRQQFPVMKDEKDWLKGWREHNKKEEKDWPSDPGFKVIEAYFPFMSILQLVFYMGWIKVAESIINPLGEDDDDFECNYVIDRNISIGLAIVENSQEKMLPKILPDQFYEDVLDDGLLYTKESTERPQHPLLGSAAQCYRHSCKKKGRRTIMVRRAQTTATEKKVVRTATGWTNVNMNSATNHSEGFGQMRTQSSKEDNSQMRLPLYALKNRRISMMMHDEEKSGSGIGAMKNSHSTSSIPDRPINMHF